ncbi:helix-turn-helix domain containing protein [Corallococcus exiguus]|nr:helix-turn-helix domain containing protein [Corallococcus exiguus]NRD59810.1 helix-turn-helix domain containing protein [Corallococcus exiguus]
MSRSGNHLKVTVPQRRALQRLARGAGSVAAGLRATIVLLSCAGDSAAHIARALGVSPRMVRDCRRRWRLGGLAGLEDARRPGRPSRADAAYVRLLVRTVQKDPRQVGYAFSRWTAPRLSEYLRQETGIVLSAYWVGELLRMHGFVWRRSKRTTKNLVDEGEKRTSPAPTARSGEGRLPAGRGLRVVVRRRGAIRLVARRAPDVAQEGATPAGGDARQERAGRRLRRLPLPGRPFSLQPPAAQRQLRPLRRTGT